MKENLKKTKMNRISDLKTIEQEVTLEDVLIAIKGNEAVKKEIDKIRVEPKKEEQHKMKQSLESFVVTGTFKSSKILVESLISQNGVFMLETEIIHKKEEIELLKQKASRIPSTIACYLSPEGSRLKILVNSNFPENTDDAGNLKLAENFKSAFSIVNDDYEKKLGVKLNSKVNSITQNHFISSDSNIYIDWDAEEFEINLETQNLNENNTDIVEEEEEDIFIPDEVFDKLPKDLKELLENYSDKRERDIVLLTTLAILGAAYSNVYYENGLETSNLNLFVFIVAPPASGKGVMKFSRIIAEQIGKEESISNIKNNPTTNYDFIIPGNISDAMIIHCLKENDGEGIIIEEEADTITKALSQDWGNFSDVLRKGYHQETIKVARAKDLLKTTIESPKFSIAITGTPDQISSLIKSVQNGLFSRFSFYSYKRKYVKYKSKKERRNGSNSKSVNERFTGFGKKTNLLSKALKKKSVKFQLRAENEFDEFWKKKTKELIQIYGNDIASTIYRTSSQCDRIMAILSVCRNHSEIVEKGKETISETKEDFESAIKIANTILNHNLKLFLKTSKRKINRKDRVLSNMKNSFKGTDYSDLMISGFNVSERTAKRDLKSLVESGKIKMLKNNLYEKVKL